MNLETIWRPYPQIWGLLILRSLPPTGAALRRTSFVQGSRDSLLKVVSAIKRVYSKHMLEVFAEWEPFQDIIAPQDDNADSYIAHKGNADSPV